MNSFTMHRNYFSVKRIQYIKVVIFILRNHTFYSGTLRLMVPSAQLQEQ